MKKTVLIMVLMMSLIVSAANEIWFVSEAGQTNLKATITQPSTGYVWDTANGPGFVASASVAWTDRDIAVAEDADNPGVYYGTFPPTISAGLYLVRIYTNAATLEITDPVLMNFTVDWGGSSEAWNNTLTAAVANVPTVSEFEARTLPAADYFDPANDIVAFVNYVTYVETTNTNTDMRGTDNAALASSLATTDGKVDSILEDTGTTIPGTITTVQTDLDTITDSGVDLKSTGLDNIATTEVDGVATTFREMIVQLWQRFFFKATSTSSALKTYKTDGTVNTTQTVSSDGVTQTVGKAE